MRLLYWTSLIIAVMLLVLNIIAVPILTHTVARVAPIHKTLYVDRNLSEDELYIIVGAAWEWHQATNGIVTYDVVRLPAKNIDVHNSIIIVIVSSDFPEMIALDGDDEERIHLAYYHETGPIPYIALVPYRISDADYKPVIMHELGHSLGLSHNEGINGIGTLMYPDIDAGANMITDADLHNFCKIYGCDANHLHDK